MLECCRYKNQEVDTKHAHGKGTNFWENSPSKLVPELFSFRNNFMRRWGRIISFWVNSPGI